MLLYEMVARKIPYEGVSPGALVWRLQNKIPAIFCSLMLN